MPLTAPPPLQPPAESRPAEPSSADWEGRLLEAFDWGRPLPAPPAGSASLRWLHAAATFDPAQGFPANPFPAGPDHREAEALRSLAQVPLERLPDRLKAQPLRSPGSALALWRWGQSQVRAGRFPPPLRRVWEDRLLAEGPPLTRGYALRHALCWALADQDERRLAALRIHGQGEVEGVLASFQRLFGLLGGPSPTLRLWALPGLAYQDLRFDQLHATRVWIRPSDGGDLPEIPAGTAWIIPSAEGGLDPRGASLPEDLAAEGRGLGERLQAAGRAAWFAPSRPAFEGLGLAWFPILIDLDAQGRIQAIRMGDAAPPTP